jgi:3-methyl-2-oxobutanoate hydroxymethyltransferase
MGHLGLTPQSVMMLGGFKVQAKTHEAAKLVIEDAQLLQDEGVFAIVIEGVPSIVGKSVTEAIDIPTIGIGAGPDTDGQVLVFHDLLGLGHRAPAKFVRQYADLGSEITEAIGRFAQDVRSGGFPDESEAYANPEGLFD